MAKDLQRKIIVDEVVKETEKAVNLKLSLYDVKKGDFQWCFWIPKSVIAEISNDEVGNIIYTIEDWFFTKMQIDAPGKIVGAASRAKAA